MTITFNEIPSNIRTNFVAIEFDSSGAMPDPSALPFAVLLLGNKTSAGTGTANTIQRVTSPSQVRTLAGAKSVLYRMAKKFFRNNQATACFIGLLDDNGAGVAASASIAITGTSTAAGTIALYVGDKLVSVGVASGQNPTTVGGNVASALNAETELPLGTAVNTTGTVAVPFAHKGAFGNDLPIRVGVNGEALPAGISVAITQMSGGTSNPVLDSFWANPQVAATWFHVIAHPYRDATSLASIETELALRQGPLVQRDGMAITSGVGSFSTLSALGLTRNSQWSAIVAQPGDNIVTPHYEFAAALAGQAAASLSGDPAMPLQTLVLNDCVPPLLPFTEFPEVNLLLYSGIATTKIAPGGVVAVDRLITTYRKNAAGADDESYLDATTGFTLQFLRWNFRTSFATRYARYKLASNGTRVGRGQKVVTPLDAEGWALTWFRKMEDRGLVENFPLFKASLVVEREGANGLSFALPPDLMNQLVTTKAAFRFKV